MARTVGIDLGTTNSVVAVMEGDKPEVIVNSEGGRVTPSVVAFAKTGERLVGQIARRQAVMNPEKTIYSIKRFMGRKYSGVAQEIKQVPYQMVAGPNDAVRADIGGKLYSPEEISSFILRKLVDDRNAVKDETTGVERLRQLTSDLQQVAHALASAAYGQATQASAAGTGAGGGGTTGGGGGDDVIDAEFTPHG